MCVKVNYLRLCLLLCVMYIPPATPYASYEKVISYVEEKTVHCDNFIIAGDFNIPEFVTNSSKTSRAINESISFLNAKQINTIVNFQSRLLDLIICPSDASTYLSRSVEPLVPESRLHPALEFSYKCNQLDYSKFKSTQKLNYNFRKADLVKLYKLIAETDWTFLSNTNDVEILCDAFYNKLYSYFDLCVPKTLKKAKVYPIWFDKETIRSIKVKNHYLKMYRKSNLSFYKTKYHLNRKIVKNKISNCYKNFMIKTERNMISDPKTFWSFVNNKKGETRIPGIMKYQGQSLDNSNQIVNAFATHFESVYKINKPVISKQSSSNHNNTSTLHIASFSEHEIISAIKSLKSRKLYGPDKIPEFLLKDCACIFSKPLKIIFDSILQNGVFPKLWKLTRITPVFKAGLKNEIVNYRPICIISNISKIFEVLLSKIIYNHVNIYLSDNQHGFRKGKSTATNLCNFTQYVSKALDEKSEVHVIYTDFSKAFDCVNFDILLDKLDCFGLSTVLLRVISSYLKQRNNFVEINGVESKSFTPLSGVPQGSNLGPLLYLVYGNDLTVSLNCNFLMYADDTKLFKIIKNPSDCVLLQNDINEMFNWSVNNQINLNIKKCQVMVYTRNKSVTNFNYYVNGEVIKKTNECKDLGVTFDTKLTFKKHIDNICLEANKMTGFIIRNTKSFSNVNVIKILYNSIVRSHLEYCCQVFNPNTKLYINKMEKIQKKVLRYMYLKVHKTYPVLGYPSNELLIEFNMLSLSNRRILSDIMFVFKILRGQIDDPNLLYMLNIFVPRMTSRYNITFYNKTTNTWHHKNSPIMRVCNLVNKYCKLDIFNCTKMQLKNHVISALISS